MYIRLSYDLTVDTVLPMEGIPLKLRRASSIEKGEISNTFYFEVNNHAGSHIDAPNHFYQNGKRIADFDISSFVFQKPLVIDVPKQDSELITSVDLVPFCSRISNCDLLLLRTGFSHYRDSGMRGRIQGYPEKPPPSLRKTVRECALWLSILSLWLLRRG